MKCSNPHCTESTPEFYVSNNRVCKTCLRAKQRVYRLSHAGRSSHFRNRFTIKGLASKRIREQRQRDKGNDKLPKAKWLKYNTVNRDTLRELIHEQCNNCVENNGGGSQTCSVAQGNEDIKLCPVWQDFNQWGIHPLPRIEDYWSNQNDN